MNFPAHLVIVKSTKIYNAGQGYCELEERDVVQMIGRAGRPQFDDSGVAVIMTSQETCGKWEQCLKNETPVESSLMEQMAEHIVAETVLGSIHSKSSAFLWLQSTYLWQRVRKNPTHYGIPGGLCESKLLQALEDICGRNIDSLEKTKVLSVNEKDEIKATDFGKIMTQFYVSFETIKLFLGVKHKSEIQHLLLLLSQAKEFSDIHLVC